MYWKPHLGTWGRLHENDWHPKMCHESSLPTKTLETRSYSNRLLIFVWLLSNSEPQALLTLKSVPSVSGRGHIPINRLPGFHKQRTISVLQLENTSDWVPSFLGCLLSSHILANVVRRLFTFDERHEEPGTVRATWGKSATWCSCTSITLSWWQKVSSRQRVTERVPLICMHAQLHPVHIPHLRMRMTVFPLASRTQYAEWMAVQGNSMATAHAELGDFIWKGKKR